MSSLRSALGGAVMRLIDRFRQSICWPGRWVPLDESHRPSSFAELAEIYDASWEFESVDEHLETVEGAPEDGWRTFEAGNVIVTVALKRREEVDCGSD